MGRSGLKPSTCPLLFCASDAGGARVLAPVAALATADRRLVLTGSGGQRIFLEETIAVSAAPGNANQAAAILQQFAPRALLVATARPDSAERLLTRAARRLGIPSVAVLDEWYDYALRFTLDGDPWGALADRICCPDSQAVAEAAAEGLPMSRLIATGSPALAQLADRIRAMAEAPPPPPAGWTPGRRTIVFLSETHSLDYGNAPGEVGPLGPYLGYTEHLVRRHLAQAVAARTDVMVLERPHPSAPPLAGAPEGAAGNWLIQPEGPLWPLLWHADMVIGMRSMALLEAAMMGHRPASYQPGLLGPQRCTAIRLGLASGLASQAELEGWLDSTAPRGAPLTPPFAGSGAAEAILTVATRLIKETRA